MTDRDEAIARGLRQFDERLREHGVALVFGAAARRIFAEVAGSELLGLGFSPRKDGSFARAVSEEIVHLVALMPLKGQQYGVQWGVSLGFVPHDWKTKPRYHRTTTAARFDLFVWPPSDLHPPGDPEYDAELADGLYGETVLRSDLTAAWNTQKEQVWAWLESARTIDAVAARALEQVSAPFGFGHDPPPAVVRAFCLARLGRAAEAKQVLEAFMALPVPIAAPANLVAALERTGPPGVR